MAGYRANFTILDVAISCGSPSIQGSPAVRLPSPRSASVSSPSFLLTCVFQSVLCSGICYCGCLCSFFSPAQPSSCSQSLQTVCASCADFCPGGRRSLTRNRRGIYAPCVGKGWGYICVCAHVRVHLALARYTARW
jgi:hypothetical protein